jgi:hypothetical protein
MNTETIEQIDRARVIRGYIQAVVGNSVRA